MAFLAALGATAAASANPVLSEVQSSREVSKEWFADPPLRYRPAAAASVGLASEREISDQLQAVIDGGFGAISIRPADGQTRRDPDSTRDPTIQRVIRAARSLRPANVEPDPLPDIGKHPTGPAAPYLSDEYFRRYAAALAFAQAHRLTAVLYDELGYPTGAAGGDRIDPANYRKLLVRSVVQAGPAGGTFVVPQGVLLATVAMNEATKERVNLTPSIAGGVLRWSPPGTGWTVQFFNIVTSTPQGGAQDYHAVIDYFDPKAVQQFIDITYEAYAQHVGRYFGNTITMTFFDDVGIYPADRTWALGLDERFKARYGRDPAIYYPALWENIGPDTAAARIAFFATRAEMLADGFPTIVTKWAAQHGLKASGHAPGQYDIQPTDMNGDPFKFYRAQPVPMIDVIFTYGFGREGFKLTTSAADALDKPVVAAEQFTTCGTPTGYKRAMDSFARGVNYLITCSRSDVGGPTAFAKWAGRASMLLQGGRRVADVAIVYPIASLQAFYRFDAPDNQEGPVGRYAPASADYLSIGDMLTGDLHRDFTFVHPDDLAGDRLVVTQGQMILENTVNRQIYTTLILPGGDVISVAALRKIKTFFDAGGKVIATTRLPTRAAEFGRDEEVLALVRGIFAAAGGVRRNRNGGGTLFVNDPTVASLRDALNQLAPPPDVAFAGDPHPRSGKGALAYIHKIKAGRHIYFFANSSDDAVASTVRLRGVTAVEIWDPYTGEIQTPAAARSVTTRGGVITELPISIGPGRSLILVGDSGEAGLPYSPNQHRKFTPPN